MEDIYIDRGWVQLHFRELLIAEQDYFFILFFQQSTTSVFRGLPERIPSGYRTVSQG